MSTSVKKFGLYAVAAIVVLSSLHFFILMPRLNNSAAEVAGYLTMVLSMIFIFPGIRHYRDQVRGGDLTFGQGLKCGMLIALFPAVAFGLFDIFYTEVLHPGWVDNYYDQHIERIRQSTPAAELEAKLRAAESQREIFSNPFLQFLLMAVTVLIIGFIVTIISAIALRRSKAAGFKRV